MANKKIHRFVNLVAAYCGRLPFFNPFLPGKGRILLSWSSGSKKNLATFKSNDRACFITGFHLSQYI